MAFTILGTLAAVGGTIVSGTTVGYDPAANLLRVAARTTADAANALQLSAALGVVLWIAIACGCLWALSAARRQLSDRHTFALALWIAVLAAWLLRTARYSPVNTGDEFVDYAQAALSVVTGLRPIELIFPTGWTQIVALMMAPGVWLSQPGGDATTETAIAGGLLSMAPLGLLLSRWLASGFLIALTIGMARALTLRVGAAAGIFAAGALLTSPHLQPLAATCSPHVPALVLAWSAVFMLACGATTQRRWAGFAGLLMGYGVGTHGLAVLVAVAALPLWWRQRRMLGYAVVAGLFGVALSNPHLLEQWPVYVENLRFRLVEVHEAEAVVDAPMANYIAKLRDTPMLWIGAMIWLIALPAQPRLRRWDLLGPAMTTVALLVLLFAVQTRFDRYIVWVLPGVIWIASVGFGAVVRKLNSTQVDALAAGAFMTICLAYYAVPIAASPCPSGIDTERPLAEIAVHRSRDPAVFVTQMPQLQRGVVAGLLPQSLADALLAEIAKRMGGRARVELRAWHLQRPLPLGFTALKLNPSHTTTATGGVQPTDKPSGAGPTTVELWELRWQRATDAAAPLRVHGLPPLRTHYRAARCGMLLRASTINRAPKRGTGDKTTTTNTATNKPASNP